MRKTGAQILQGKDMRNDWGYFFTDEKQERYFLYIFLRVKKGLCCTLSISFKGLNSTGPWKMGIELFRGAYLITVFVMNMRPTTLPIPKL